MSTTAYTPAELQGYFDEFRSTLGHDMLIWKLEPERKDHLRAAARRTGTTVRWNLMAEAHAITGGSTLTMWGAQRRARRAFTREDERVRRAFADEAARRNPKNVLKSHVRPQAM